MNKITQIIPIKKEKRFFSAFIDLFLALIIGILLYEFCFFPIFQNNTDFKNKEVAYNYIRCMAGLTENQYKKIDEGKVVKKYVKKNISVGIMEEYFDYSF